jgi:hypothetical protein
MSVVFAISFSSYSTPTRYLFKLGLSLATLTDVGLDAQNPGRQLQHTTWFDREEKRQQYILLIMTMFVLIVEEYVPLQTHN